MSRSWSNVFWGGYQSANNDAIDDLPISQRPTVLTSEAPLKFLPDYTEHPKPKRRYTNRVLHQGGDGPPSTPDEAVDDDDDDVTFFHDFIAGGVAGSASVVVGHPFDTVKVRLQTSGGSLSETLRAFGGFSSLFRGMGAPLAAAAGINAIVFGSYGFSSRLYNEYIPMDVIDAEDETTPNHDPWQKSLVCGSFAGAVQCSIICPMEHVKCRLQTQHTSITGYRGPADAIRRITLDHGITRLFQGFWSTALREIPAFGVYFASYDYLKDKAVGVLRDTMEKPQPWLASAFAGGCAGSITWAMVYPVDVIKTRVQTSPLTTPFTDLRMWNVAQTIVQEHGVRYLFRGLGITLLRAFPVNGTIFPVYEFTLEHLTSLGY